jgi:hypothetical protein
MGNGAIQPLAATPGPLRVLCGATPSSMLLGEGLTAWRRERRRIPVLDSTQPSNTKFGLEHNYLGDFDHGGVVDGMRKGQP